MSDTFSAVFTGCVHEAKGLWKGTERASMGSRAEDAPRSHGTGHQDVRQTPLHRAQQHGRGSQEKSRDRQVSTTNTKKKKTTLYTFIFFLLIPICSNVFFFRLLQAERASHAEGPRGVSCEIKGSRYRHDSASLHRLRDGLYFGLLFFEVCPRMRSTVLSTSMAERERDV